MTSHDGVLILTQTIHMQPAHGLVLSASAFMLVDLEVFTSQPLVFTKPCKLVLQRSHHTHVVRKSCRSFPLHCIVASVCGFCNLGERKIFRMKLQKHLQIQEISQTVKNQKPSVLLRILL